MTARRLAKGVLAAALAALWTMLIVTIDPHALAFYTATPQLAVTLGWCSLAPASSLALRLGGPISDAALPGSLGLQREYTAKVDLPQPR